MEWLKQAEKSWGPFFIYMLTLVSWRFPALSEVSFCVRTFPNCQRNRARSYYYIVYYRRSIIDFLFQTLYIVGCLYVTAKRLKYFIFSKKEKTFKFKYLNLNIRVNHTVQSLEVE